ncbi:hypothetical protein [Paractinoplanes durhamensis]
MVSTWAAAAARPADRAASAAASRTRGSIGVSRSQANSSSAARSPPDA